MWKVRLSHARLGHTRLIMSRVRGLTSRAPATRAMVDGGFAAAIC